MLSPYFAIFVRSSIEYPIVSNDTYVVIEPDSVRVLGFTIDPVFATVALTITIASADGSTIYDVITMSSTVATHYVSSHPWVADKGLAWKSTGAALQTLVTASFFITHHGT